MNGIERFSERDKEYFTLNQPMVHHTSIPGFNIKETGSPIMLSTHLSVGTNSLDTPNSYNNENTYINLGVITLEKNNGTIPKIGDIVMVTSSPSRISTVKEVNATGTTIKLSSNDIEVVGNFHVHIIALASNPKSRCSDLTKNIYVYSFSLNPEEHQPSGICNFTRLDDVKLSIDSSKTIDKIYAVNYNVLRISNGLAALVYT